VENDEAECAIVRLSVPIDRGLNDQFAGMMPFGLKAQVIRSLVELVIKTQQDLGTKTYLIHHLINGECKLVIEE